MKKMLLPLLMVFLVFVCGSSRLNAQASVTARATAEIITSISALEGAILNFGRFSPQEIGGEVVIAPDGSRYSSGTVVLGVGLYNQAVFYITGQPEYNVAISLPTMPTMLTNLSNGKSMEVRNWTSSPSLESDLTLPSNGSLNLNMGATLKVGDFNENPVGLYSGTYIITFSYN